jgi:hypothetical protein
MPAVNIGFKQHAFAGLLDFSPAVVRGLAVLGLWIFGYSFAPGGQPILAFQGARCLFFDFISPFTRRPRVSIIPTADSTFGFAGPDCFVAIIVAMAGGKCSSENI